MAQKIADSKVSRGEEKHKVLNCIWKVILVYVHTDYDVKINLPRK